MQMFLTSSSFSSSLLPSLPLSLPPSLRSPTPTPYGRNVSPSSTCATRRTDGACKIECSPSGAASFSTSFQPLLARLSSRYVVAPPILPPCLPAGLLRLLSSLLSLIKFSQFLPSLPFPPPPPVLARASIAGRPLPMVVCRAGPSWRGRREDGWRAGPGR